MKTFKSSPESTPTQSKILRNFKQHPILMSHQTVHWQRTLVPNHIHNIVRIGAIINFNNIEPLHITDEDPLLRLDVDAGCHRLCERDRRSFEIHRRLLV